MNILFFDDEQERFDIFKASHQTDNVFWVRNIAQLSAALRTGGMYFNEIHLDHDIGDEKVEGTGKEAAFIVGCFIRACFSMWNVEPKITVHSWNVVAGDEMMKILANFSISATRREFNNGENYGINNHD